MPSVDGPSSADIYREEAGERGKCLGEEKGRGGWECMETGRGGISVSSLPSSPSFRAELPDSSLASEAPASIKHPGHVPTLLPEQLQALFPTLASVWGRCDEMGPSTDSSTDFGVSEGPGGPGRRGRGCKKMIERTLEWHRGRAVKRLEPGSSGHHCFRDFWDLGVGQGLSVTLQTDPS